MLNRRRSPVVPTFQWLQAPMRDFDYIPTSTESTHARPSAATPPSNSSTNPCAAGPSNNSNSAVGADASSGNGNWREAGKELRRVRSHVVVMIERMLRAHQPHEVLTQVPENTDWQSKTFVLALKIERLMFLAAPSRENYLNENTLRSRVQRLSHRLVRSRIRKNAMATIGT